MKATACKSGQVLAVLDDAQSRSAVDQATAAVTAAEKERLRRRFGLVLLPKQP